MQTIYVVEYKTGEYDSKIDFPVCAFQIELQAAIYCDEFNAALKEAGAHMNQESYPPSGPFHFRGKDFTMDYTGADVTYYPLTLDP